MSMEETDTPAYNEKVCAQCRSALRKVSRDKKARATGKYWRCLAYGRPAMYCFNECKKYKELEAKLVAKNVA